MGKLIRILKGLMHRLLVVAGAVALALAFFLVLPLMQQISKPPADDLIVQQVDTARLEPPPPPPEEPEEEPEPEEEEPPELMEQESKPLDLSQLEVALNPGFGGAGGFGGDFSVDLKTVASGNQAVESIFSMADLDQRPRVVYQPGPVMNREMRRKAPGQVYVIFMVNKQGRVEQPKVQKSSDPVFEQPAVKAVKQWKFEPGKRGGDPVRFRMRVPITFPKG